MKNMPTFRLVLLHGRNSVDEQMDDWGFEGPKLEGIRWIHWTYGHWNIRFADEATCKRAQKLTGWHHGLELDVDLRPDFAVNDDGLIEANGKFYGDWELQIDGPYEQPAVRSQAKDRERIRRLEKCLADVRNLASEHFEALARGGDEDTNDAREFAGICTRINRTL